MAAATAAREDKRSEGRLKSFDVAAVAVYKGTLVGLNSSGYLTSMLHSTASLRFRGVCVDTKDNSGGSAGDMEARVWQDGEYEFVYNGGDAAQALVGEKAYAVDNQTVDEDPTTVTNEYPIGTIVEVISTTKVRVRIEPSFAANDAAQAAIVSLTDSTGDSGTHDDTLADGVTVGAALTDNTAGTADTTLQALADGTTYATDVAAIRNNFADLAARCNALRTDLLVQNQNDSDMAQKILEILTALRGAGIIAQ